MTIVTHNTISLQLGKEVQEIISIELLQPYWIDKINHSKIDKSNYEENDNTTLANHFNTESPTTAYITASTSLWVLSDFAWFNVLAPDKDYTIVTLI